MTPEEMIKLITKDYKIDSNKFNMSQMDEICLGILHGLSVKDLHIYAKPNVPSYKMSRARCQLEKDMRRIVCKFNLDESIEMIKEKGIYIDGLTPQQYHQIKIGIDHNLSIKQIKLYTKKELDADRMEFVRELIETGFVSNYDIKKYYANNKYTLQEAKDIFYNKFI